MTEVEIRRKTKALQALENVTKEKLIYRPTVYLQMCKAHVI